MSKSKLWSFETTTALALISLCLTTSVQAEIYKWRDNKGIIQYSDTPPSTAYTKATRAEMVNAMQTKSEASMKVPNTNAIGTRKISANLMGLGPKTMAQASSPLSIAGMSGSKSTSSTSKSSPIATGSKTVSASSNANKSPLGIGAVSNFSSSGKMVTVFGTQLKPLVKTSPGIGSLVSNAGPTSTKPQSTSTSNTSTTQTSTGSTTTNAPTNTTTGTETTVATNQTSANTSPTSGTTTNIVQMGLMPAVDISKNITPAIGASDYRINPTTEQPSTASDGAFRIECFPSHMSNDDPLVYPNQPGASPHKTYFGNTSVNAKSDLNNLANIGNGTCKGGIMNRSSYAVPSMIDTSTHTPIVPEKAIFYYKTGGLEPGSITPPPKGLRMITGNANANSEETSQAMFTCLRPSGQPFYGWKKSIPACVVGETMQMLIRFPQCWDGKNLDSLDHKSHMAHTVNGTGGCPASHPIGMPQVTLGLNFVITSENRTQFWRLSSDNYDPSKPPGYSANADWVNGWDEKILSSFVKNCLNASKDCHAHLVGDGRMFYKGVIN